jgi:ribosomal protein S18 acetylase RimI-like enzyme
MTTQSMPRAPQVPGVTFRPFRDATDYKRIADLVGQTNLEDAVPWMPTAAQLRTEMETSSGIEPTLDVLFAEVDGMSVAATAVERGIRDGVPVYDMSGNVLTEFRRRGLGTALLAWTLDRIRVRAAIEDPGIEVVVQGGAEERETGHRAILDRAGFVPTRHFFLMHRASLDDVPDVPLPEGLEVRPVAEDQRRAIIAAEFEAFRDHWGAREMTEGAVRATLEMAELNTDLWVVAWDGDQIAGAVENWIWPEENEKLGVQRGWLERISVRRPWRRRGLGRALTAASLIRLREAGLVEAMLGVDSGNPNGALGLYEGLGFTIHSRSAAYRRTLER